MSIEDDYRRRVIQENLVKLVDRLSPDELLPHLSCLSRQSQQKIRCRLAQEGQQAATVLLLDDLPRKDNWWEQLMSALCHPAVGQVDMAELLQTQEDIFRGINTKSEKLELIAEVHKGAPQNEKMPPYKTRKVEINWSTPLQKLPFSVVKVLQRLDVESKWKDLAAQTEFLLHTEIAYDLRVIQWNRWTVWKHIQTKTEATFKNYTEIFRQDTISRYVNL